ncbi:tripartite tricarboxylate transporter substrate binding protein [Bradyrhizobium sp. AUGA SZCCT0431]|uniref:Bug family tripartite tricarboxylate transporter substrate binding protein n=1 Tax=Bradyrhizobium sp. AUGA SZCCT0431 TaxID=2807674 RepID=UPI001BAA30CA|nr:tripartite tricarboxylate transporter substrate binding protein [Bradyrhizobium sp. AUGA SZCCT0431]MBR1147282.1 tripartite tricarboxylate transporter substrate binding protein [Bradyrhizobium sp. AUGA SZCCT0431]
MASVSRLMRPTRLACAASALAFVAATAGPLPIAVAQDFPAKPITLIIPFPAGGATDIAGRVLAERMAISLKQAIVVDNRAGAAGAIGIKAVATAAPDGYTLGVSGVGTTALLEPLGRNLGFSPGNDLNYVGHMGSSAMLIATKSDLGAKSMSELIALARSKPEQLTYGTSGIGSPGHLAMEWLLLEAGIKILHLPYRGNAPLLNDLVGKHADLGVLTIPGTSDQVKAGNIVPIAVTGTARSDELPDVPTTREAGIRDFAAELWNVLVAPKGTPQPIVDKISAALAEAMKDPGVHARFKANGLVPETMTPAETRVFVDTERAKWADVVRKSGVKAD